MHHLKTWRAMWTAARRRLSGRDRRGRRARLALVMWGLGSAAVTAAVWGGVGVAQGANRTFPAIDGFPPSRAHRLEQRPEAARVGETELRASVERRHRRLRESGRDVRGEGRRASTEESAGDLDMLAVPELPRPGAALPGVPPDSFD